MFVNKNDVKLLRIPFSFFLMPLFLLALSQTAAPVFIKTILSFGIIHFLIYPASNGYNSYVDRDEESIGGLEKPPLPSRQLLYMSILLDLLGVALAFAFVSAPFALCLLLYITASRAYSSRQIRLKKYPYLGFAVVVFFQGAFTYYTALWGITAAELVPGKATLFILLGCSFQIAGAYPLTQVYQHRQDLKDGVITISYRLGYKGTFIFTGIMFLLCNLCYYLYFSSVNKLFNFYILQLFFLPIVIYFGYWFYKVILSSSNANFKNTMRMNWIAATCMNSCFIMLYYLNHR